MKKIIALFAFGSLFLAGCPKHEIIPAPTPRVDLESSFIGLINGTQVELTQNVGGYYLDVSKSKYILPSPTPSRATYFADMKSPEDLLSIRIGLGAALFDGGSSGGDPSLSVFNTFFTSTTTPTYSDNGTNGFDVTYRDGNGGVWKSDETSTPQDAIFTGIVQESDGSGDYSKFTCTFNCIVYRDILDVSTPDPNDSITLSLPIQNAVFKGWFQR
ncbi:hypothetical protein [Fluviicola taffensis]|uniref:Lipoprotein n=1 Tax=Fluviicola taffensis (strain DSM 16823 / NCIMB 13979 / RW262) TaxID=755732 RepID=F2I9S4_FLUTR|nr:hypothetical protein [Fluviicola taffensis]AEA43070.1 hypothetical protein Fluta_1072 [Fluviicola taffensis DSM 16823]